MGKGQSGVPNGVLGGSADLRLLHAAISTREVKIRNYYSYIFAPRALTTVTRIYIILAILYLPLGQNANLGIGLRHISVSVGFVPQGQVIAGHQGDHQFVALGMVPDLDLNASGDQLLAGNLLLRRSKSLLVGSPSQTAWPAFRI